MKNLKKPARLPRKAPSNQTGGTAWGKKLAAEFSRMVQSADMKKLILLNFPYIIAFYMVEKAAWLYRHCNGDSVVDRLMVLFMNFGLAYKSVLPSFHPFDLMVGLVGAAALKAVIYFKGKNAKKYRQGEECAAEHPMSFKVPDRLLTDGQCRMRINGVQFVQALLEANGLAAGKDYQFKGRYEAEKNAVIISLEKDEREW